MRPEAGLGRGLSLAKDEVRQLLAGRRARLAEALATPALIVAGRARARNYPANHYAYRAESHFLYFVGASLEGAALYLSKDREAVLYAEPTTAESTLWSGPRPALEDLERELGLTVRPLAELSVAEGTATLPPMEAATAAWQRELLGRPIVACGGAKLSDGDPDAGLATAVIGLRLVHDSLAVAELREAARLTTLAHEAGRRALASAGREAEVRAAMEGALCAEGVGTAYGSIVTVDGQVLHREESRGALVQGDLLLADVGAESPGYWASDVTRTWPVSGRFSPTQRALYLAVLRVQQAALEAVRPGVEYRAVHHRAGRALIAELLGLGLLRGDPEELFQRQAHALFFPHGIGHLLGLDVHDLEDLGDRAGYAPGRKRSTTHADRYLRLDRPLQAGMAVTIEPGFYQVPGILADPERVGALRDAVVWKELERYADVRGIRIEDPVLVTAEGAEVLTPAIPKDPEALEALAREDRAPRR